MRWRCPRCETFNPVAEAHCVVCDLEWSEKFLTEAYSVDSASPGLTDERPKNETVTDSSGVVYRLEVELGEGSRAVVWRAIRLDDSNPVAIKLWRRRPGARQREAEVDRLKAVMEVAAKLSNALPPAQVCAPRAVISSSKQFGVIMDLAAGKPLSDSKLIDFGPHEQRDGYVSEAFHSISRGRLKHWHLLLGAFHLARALAVMHRHRVVHGDLSLGNVFINPANGEISLIHCDSLQGDGLSPSAPRGTPGFRAPELIRDRSRPLDSVTDAHSLAVVAFQMIMLRHPLIGCRTAKGNPLENVKAEEAAFGAKALFTEHPTDAANCFSGGLPFSVLPRPLCDLFCAAFVNGIKDPTQRPGASSWASTLWESLESMTECTTCRQRIFATNFGGTCMYCGTDNRRERWWLVFGNGRRMLAEPGRKLYEHHVGGKEFQFERDLARIQITTKGEPAMMNSSDEVWKLRTGKGSTIHCPPGSAFPFSAVKTVEFTPGRTAEVCSER